MKRCKLPIGLRTFREIREGGCYYADETSYAPRLVDEGEPCSLSRPPRFGKSLFVDTLKELFEGNRLPVRRRGAGRASGRRRPPRAAGHGGAVRRAGPPVRGQDGREGAGRNRSRAARGEGGYADEYRHLGQPIHLIGVWPGREARDAAGFAAART